MFKEIIFKIEHKTKYFISQDGVVKSVTVDGEINYPRGAFRRGFNVFTVGPRRLKRSTFNVHLEVGKAFVEGYAPGKKIIHLDFDKSNNSAENLRWVTAKEQAQFIKERNKAEGKPITRNRAALKNDIAKVMLAKRMLKRFDRSRYASKTAMYRKIGEKIGVKCEVIRRLDNQETYTDVSINNS